MFQRKLIAFYFLRRDDKVDIFTTTIESKDTLNSRATALCQVQCLSHTNDAENGMRIRRNRVCSLPYLKRSVVYNTKNQNNALNLCHEKNTGCDARSVSDMVWVSLRRL